MIVIIEGQELSDAVKEYVAINQNKDPKDLHAELVIKDNTAYFEVMDKEDIKSDIYRED